MSLEKTLAVESLRKTASFDRFKAYFGSSFAAHPTYLGKPENRNQLVILAVMRFCLEKFPKKTVPGFVPFLHSCKDVSLAGEDATIRKGIISSIGALVDEELLLASVKESTLAPEEKANLLEKITLAKKYEN